MKWTDEKVAELKRLVKDRHSGSQIAAIFGATRNSVIGKCHRLGITLNSQAVKKAGWPKANRRRPKRQPVPKVRRTEPLPPLDEVDLFVFGPELPTIYSSTDSYLATMTLGENSCRYPYGDPLLPGFGYCGRHTDRVYCDDHMHGAYQAPAKRIR